MLKKVFAGATKSVCKFYERCYHVLKNVLVGATKVLAGHKKF